VRGAAEGIARKVKEECVGDLTAVLKQRLREAKEPGNGVKAAKKVLQQFPVVGEPSAEKTLLFSGLAPVAAVPSAFVDVPVRLLLVNLGRITQLTTRLQGRFSIQDWPKRSRRGRELTCC
jgi:hypothetical protein